MTVPPKRRWHDRKDIWILRAVALLITVVLWLSVMGGKSIEVIKTLNIDYRLPQGLTIANQVPKTVDVRVSGPQSFIKDFENRVSSVPVDLSQARQGDYEVVLKEEMLQVPIGIKILSISRKKIPLQLDQLAAKTVPIRASFSRPLPENVKIKGVTLRPSTLEVKGAASRLARLDSLVTSEISLTGNSLQEDFDVDLAAGEHTGVLLDEKDKSVHVTVELEATLSRRWFNNLPVELRLGGQKMTIGEGAPAPYNEVKVLPTRVRFMLEGPQVVIDGLSEDAVVVWAELEKFRPGTYQLRLNWKLPPDVRVIRRSTDFIQAIVPRI